MKRFKTLILLTTFLLSFSCSDDDSNTEPTILFDMLYSGTYTTNLRDTESSNPPQDEDYIMELYPSKSATTTGRLTMKGQTIPFTARKYEISRYPNDKFFQINIKDYNETGNNASMVFWIKSSTYFSYETYSYDNEYIRDIIAPLIGEYFYLID